MKKVVIFLVVLTAVCVVLPTAFAQVDGVGDALDSGGRRGELVDHTGAAARAPTTTSSGGLFHVIAASGFLVFFSSRR